MGSDPPSTSDLQGRFEALIAETERKIVAQTAYIARGGLDRRIAEYAQRRLLTMRMDIDVYRSSGDPIVEGRRLLALYAPRAP